jgi:hypothetical protein
MCSDSCQSRQANNSYTLYFLPVSPQLVFDQLLRSTCLCYVHANQSLQAHTTVLHIQSDMLLLVSQCRLGILLSVWIITDGIWMGDWIY